MTPHAQCRLANAVLSSSTQSSVSCTFLCCSRGYYIPLSFLLLPFLRYGDSRLEATVWAVPSLIENAVAVSLIGVLLGPMYPILVNYAKDVLPRWLLTGALGWIVGIGQAGSAALPFITGLLAAKYGIASLQPL